MINRKLRHTLGTLLVLPVAVLLAYTPAASAQNYTPLPRAQAQAAFSQQALDQMLAPIALYPDSLLSQILMASTYPLEVVEAARWSRAYPGLTGDRAVRAVERMDWDPSVKSLAAFPEILAMMDEKLNWTESLGDAFLAQEPQVMDSVQYLRQKAYAAGNLRSNEWMRVQTQGLFIAVEPLDPRIIYVPYYDPLVVYGPWWWPAYPPVYWAPPVYYVVPAHRPVFLWGPGIVISVNFFFGQPDWHRRHVTVVHHYPTTIVNRGGGAVNVPPAVWRHEPDHRRGMTFRSEAVRDLHPGVVTPAIRTEPRPDPARSEPRPAAAPAAPVIRVEPRHDSRPAIRAEHRPEPRPAANAERHVPRAYNNPRERSAGRDRRS